MAGLSETRTYDALLTTTLAKFENEIQDQIFDDNPLLSFLNGKLGKGMSKGKKVKKTHDGGESIVKQLMYEKNTTVDSYSGYETIDTSGQDGMTIARFNWKNYAGTVAISGPEKRMNAGESQMVNLLEAKKDQLVMSLRDRLSVDAFGDGTGNGGRNLTGLSAHISATATVGGISPTTYTWWVPYSNTSVGSYTGNGKNALRTAVNSLTFGASKPSIIFTTQTIYEWIEAAEDAKERFQDKATLDLGFENIVFKKIPILFDRDCTSGAMYLLNSEHISFDVHKDADFKLHPFQTDPQQDATSAKMLFMGNITINNRRKHGILSGITA